jgi:hypothetical protein
VGGEPTLDLDEFERVLDTVTEWQLPLEMTTNGWWLRSHQTLTKFLRIVLPAVRDHEMTIRISDSVWHDAFRTPHELRLLEVGLEDLFSNPFDHLYQYEPSKCPECGQTETEENEVGDRVCVGCGCSEDDFYPDMPGMSIIEEAHQYLERIHVDRQGNNPEKLSPVGRARRSYFAAGQDGACGATADVKFTFEPGAKLYDPCCNGGHVKLGSARDPEQLFRARYWFMRALHAKFPSPQSYKHNALGGERCRQCPVFGAQWLVKNTKSHIHNELQSLVGS